jgi:transposase
MQKFNKSNLVFKDYNINQNLLLPPSLEELIPPNHPVRAVSQVVDNLNIDPIVEKYQGGGCPSYHPRMMLKVVIYGYLTNLYSSRKIEQALHESIPFMWLSGMSYPDHNTINRFRSDRLKGVLKEVFSQLVLLLIDHGHISLEEAYLDGTKIEANANRYTFVWGRRVKTYKERIKDQLKELWAYAESVAKDELKNQPVEFEQIDAEKVSQTVEQIDRALEGKEVDSKVKKKLSDVRRKWPEKLARYEKQEKLLGDRSSYSRTDPDATFMRMKEDHLRNGQLKPAYNWQVSTQDQYILGYTLHQTTNDLGTLVGHMESIKATLGQMPRVLVADAGYGSEKNYEYLEENNVEAFVQYNHYYNDQKKKWKEDPHLAVNLHYNEKQDCFYCPMGQPMTLIDERYIEDKSGYKLLKKWYKAQRCEGCPMRGPCHNCKGDRVVQAAPKWFRYKSKVKKRLDSERGQDYISRRRIEVEPVFGMIKNNRNYRRFLLRGLDKVEIEAGLLSMAHNLGKMAG